MERKEHIVILYIEDDPAHAEFTLRSLRKRINAKVTHVSDGQTGLDYLYHRGKFASINDSPRPHLILLDLRIPKIDGLEVLKIIKSDEELQCIPTIILTTSNAETDVTSAYKLHANSYLVKPLEFDQFFDMINTLGLYWVSMNMTYKCVET